MEATCTQRMVRAAFRWSRFAAGGARCVLGCRPGDECGGLLPMTASRHRRRAGALASRPSRPRSSICSSGLCRLPRCLPCCGVMARSFRHGAAVRPRPRCRLAGRAGDRGTRRGQGTGGIPPTVQRGGRAPRQGGLLYRLLRRRLLGALRRRPRACRRGSRGSALRHRRCLGETEPARGRRRLHRRRTAPARPGHGPHRPPSKSPRPGSPPPSSAPGSTE